MRVTEHTPPRYQRIPEADPCILLSGTPREAIKIFRAMPDDEFILHLACPMAGSASIGKAERADWADFHMLRSVDKGGILLWLAAEAADPQTLITFGEVLGMTRSGQSINAVVGVEKSHPTEHAITWQADKLGIPVAKDLSTAAEALIHLVTSDME